MYLYFIKMTVFHSIKEKHSILVRILSYNNNDVNNVGISSFGVRLFSPTIFNEYSPTSTNYMSTQWRRKKVFYNVRFYKIKKKKNQNRSTIKAATDKSVTKAYCEQLSFLINVFTQLLLQLESKSVREKTVQKYSFLNKKTAIEPWNLWIEKELLLFNPIANPSMLYLLIDACNPFECICPKRKNIQPIIKI